MRVRQTRTPVLGRGTHAPVPPNKKLHWKGQAVPDTGEPPDWEQAFLELVKNYKHVT